MRKVKRNPVAKNLNKFNKPSSVPDKRQKDLTEETLQEAFIALKKYNSRQKNDR